MAASGRGRSPSRGRGTTPGPGAPFLGRDEPGRQVPARPDRTTVSSDGRPRSARVKRWRAPMRVRPGPGRRGRSAGRPRAGAAVRPATTPARRRVGPKPRGRHGEQPVKPAPARLGRSDQARPHAVLGLEARRPGQRDQRAAQAAARPGSTIRTALRQRPHGCDRAARKRMAEINAAYEQLTDRSRPGRAARQSSAARTARRPVRRHPDRPSGDRSPRHLGCPATTAATPRPPIPGGRPIPSGQRPIPLRG